MRIAAALLAALIGAAPAWAENRAVIVGNADYRSAPDLAGSDTVALGNTLRVAGFTTQQGVDLAADPLRRLIESLVRADPAPGARIVALNGRFLNDGTETWFMGADAEEPGRLGVGMQGVPLSLVMRLMAGGDPGAVLVLGTDGQRMPHRPGLENGIGPLAPPRGVWVVTGSPEAGARAMGRLAGGASLVQAMAADPALQLVPGGARDPVLAPRRKVPDPQAADRDAWAEASTADGMRAYQDYLARFPRGLYAAPARERLAQIRRAPAAQSADRHVWARAAAEDSAAGYVAYLQDFPAGRFARVARLRLAELRPVRPGPDLSPAAAAEQALNLAPAERAAIQRHLSQLGGQPGPADGVFGQRTRAAITDWQRRNGLAATGHLTRSQVRMLATQVERLQADAAAATAPGGGRRVRRAIPKDCAPIWTAIPTAFTPRPRAAGSPAARPSRPPRPPATRRPGAGPAARARPRPTRPIWTVSRPAPMRRRPGSGLPPCAPASKRRAAKNPRWA